MSEEHPTIGDPTYELLKKMHGDVQELRLDMLDIKVQLSATEEHLGTMMVSSAGINTRLDRIEERLGRVERRLDLTDAK